MKLKKAKTTESLSNPSINRSKLAKSYEKAMSTLMKPKLRTDEFCKKFMLKDMRAVIKASYHFAYGNRRHYQCNKSKKKDCREFWTGKVW